MQWSTPCVVGALQLICVYAGYFNGGAGIVIIALLGLLGKALPAVLGSDQVCVFGGHGEYVGGDLRCFRADPPAAGMRHGDWRGARPGCWARG